jgi:hypothetical protein
MLDHPWLLDAGDPYENNTLRRRETLGGCF